MTWEYRGLQGVLGGYRGFQGVTGGDKGLQGVSKDYRNFSLPRTFQIRFLGLFCITIKVEVISKFRSKRWTNPFAKMPILCVFKTDIFVVQKGLFAI